MNTVETDLARQGGMPRKMTVNVKRTNPLRPLVSGERSQKFDLLRHLISNIHDGVVICGPKGIGKSFLLDLIQAEKRENWTVCRIQGSSATGFEDVQNALIESIHLDSRYGVQKPGSSELSNLLAHFKRDGRLLVLLLDDAGEMLPGNLDRVCQFADANPALRLVLSMTADRLHLALSSDPAIANCQVIEIPPLTESQCGEFLQNLSGKPGALISFKAVTPALVQYVYRKSHGVPGTVISMLPELSQIRLSETSPIAFPAVGVIALLTAISLGYWLWISTNDPDSLPTRASVSGDEPSRKVVSIPLGIHSTPGEPESRPDAVADSKPTGTNSDPKSRTTGLESSGNPSVTLTTPSSSGPPTAPANVLSPGSDPGKNLAGSNTDWNRPELNSAPHSAPPGDPPDSELANGTLRTGTDKDEWGNAIRLPEPYPSPRAARSATDESPSDVNSGVSVVQPDTPQGPETDQPVPANHETDQPGAENQPLQSETRTKNHGIEGVRGSHWIRQQDARQFTLQLMASTNLEAIQSFLKSHSELESLAIFRTRKGGTTWYALIRGIYPSLSAAKRAAKTLPAGLQNAWPRSFRSVQKAMVDSDSR